jgi:hypothetical protein
MKLNWFGWFVVHVSSFRPRMATNRNRHLTDNR